MAQLTVVTGQPAVGKTTWAQHFASEQHACLIDIDRVFEPVIKAGLALAGMPEDDRDSQAYKQAFRQPVYTAMYASAAANLPHVPVVLCAPFTRELAQADWAEQLHKQFGCSVEVMWLTAPMATITSSIFLSRRRCADIHKLRPDKQKRQLALPFFRTKCATPYSAFTLAACRPF